MADGVDIGTLSGRVEFEDNVSKTLDLILGRIDQLDGKFGDLDGTIAHTAAGVLSGEAAFALLKKGIEATVSVLKDMTVEGAAIGDVSDNFQHLTATAGRLSSTLLNELRQGTHNTIADLDLMKMANRDLAAGMNLTDGQFRTLASGAFALAKATGVSVKDAMETMNDAMLTGRTRAVAMLTGKIDLTKAEQDFASKLGTTVDRLNDEGKVQSARIAILDSVGAATQRLGEQTDGMDKKAEQAEVSWKNFYNELSMSIGTSPRVSQAFDTIRTAVAQAFGTDKEALIKNITHGVNSFADTVTKYGPPVIGWLSDVAHWTTTIAKGTGFMDWLHGMQDDVSMVSLSLQGFSAAEAKAMIATQRAAEAAAAKAAADRDSAAASSDHAKHEEELAEAQKHVTEVSDKNKYILQQTNEEIKKHAEALKELQSASGTWQEILAKLDKTMVDSIAHYLDAGVAQDKLATAYGLTATQIGAINKMLEEQKKQEKLAEKAAIDSQERWTEFYADQRAMSGTTTDLIIANITSWKAAQIKAHKDAKTDTADFYLWVEAAARQHQEVENQHRLESSNQSKAYWDLQARQAKDAYDFALMHSDQFTQGYIDGLKNTSDAAQNAAEHWRDSAGKALDDLKDKAEAFNKELKVAFSFDVTSQNLQQTLSGMHPNGDPGAGDFGGKYQSAVNLARKGYGFQEILAFFNGAPLPEVPIGPRIPGFRDGGVGDFGDGTLAMLHGKEAIVPLDGHVGGMGTITNVFHVNGTAQDTARQIGEILMNQLKSRRYLPSAG